MNDLELCSAYGCNGSWSKAISDTIPLCQLHFAYAHAAWGNYVDKMVKATEQLDPENVMVQARRFYPRGSVVYYVKMNDLIKIGTTSDFKSRMASLYVQPSDVLAVEPGDQKLEASRHKQFAPFRVKGTELFRANAVMADLIASLREDLTEYRSVWDAGDRLTFPRTTDEWVTQAELDRSPDLLRKPLHV